MTRQRVYNITSPTLPKLSTEQVWQCVNGDISIQWGGKALIKKFSALQLNDLQMAIQKGYVVGSPMGDMVSNAFFHLCEGSNKPYIRIARKPPMSEVAMDLLTTDRRNLTEVGAQQIYDLLLRFAVGHGVFNVGTLTTIEKTRTANDEYVASSLLAIAAKDDTRQYAPSNLSAFWQRIFPDPEYPKSSHTVKIVRRIVKNSARELAPDVDYDAYIRSEAWRTRREAVLTNANYRCQMCGLFSARLDAHHNNYDRLGNELLGDLIALCPECHHIADNRRRQNRPTFND